MKLIVKILLYLTCILASCTQKKNAKDSFFEIPIVEYYPEVFRTHVTVDSIIIDSARVTIQNCYVRYELNRFFTEMKVKYTRCPQHIESSMQYLEYNGTDAEVEYSLPGDYYHNNCWYPSYYKYFIGIQDKNGISKGFLIRWINMRETLEQFKADNVNVSQSNKRKEYFEEIPWEIGSHTDSIETNLSYNEVKNLYPEFQGSYKHIKCDSIVIIHDGTRFTNRNPEIYYRKQ